MREAEIVALQSLTTPARGIDLTHFVQDVIVIKFLVNINISHVKSRKSLFKTMNLTVLYFLFNRVRHIIFIPCFNDSLFKIAEDHVELL